MLPSATRLVAAYLLFLILVIVSTSTAVAGPLPRWFVLGKTRVGKGLFVSSALASTTGERVNIVSDQLVSHTKRVQGYELKLGNREAEIFDTVGFEDSSCTNLSEETFLKLLADSGTADLYPPLFILQALAASDVAFLKKLVHVFSSVVVAVRGSKKQFLNAPESVAAMEIPVREIFHLHEFLDPDDDEGRSHKLYEADVQDILNYYAEIAPTREDLNFNSTLFQGQYEYVKIKDESKEDLVVRADLITNYEELPGTVARTINTEETQYETREVCWNSNEFILFRPFLFALCQFDLVPKAHKTDSVTVHKDVVVYETVMLTTQRFYKKTTNVRVVYSRGVYEVWKVLAGGIRIFKETMEGEWKIEREEVLGTELDRCDAPQPVQPAF